MSSQVLRNQEYTMSKKRKIAKWSGFVMILIGVAIMSWIIVEQNRIINEQVQLKQRCLDQKNYLEFIFMEGASK